MQDFFDLLREVWATGFLGIDLGSLISSLLVLLVAFLFRGFIISVILNALGRLAESTESKIDDEIAELNGLSKDDKSKKIKKAITDKNGNIMFWPFFEYMKTRTNDIPNIEW